MRRNLFTRHRPSAPTPVASGSPSNTRYLPSLQMLEDRVTPTLGTFELDGNATAQSTHDWDQVYNDAVLNPGQNTSGSISGAVFFKHGPLNSPTDDVFVGGQTTDINDLNQWRDSTGTAPDAADLADAFAVAYSVPVNGVNHTVINFGADRFDNSGTATLGVWLFQSPIGVNPVGQNNTGTFTGAHTVGDILVLADFSGSVATISAYRWVGPGGSTSALQPIATDPNTIFVTTNTTNTPSGGWPFTDKSGNPGNIMAPGEFVEGGIDLTALGLATNLNSVLLETRASNSLGAALKDFALGTFDTFRPDLVVTKDDGVTSAVPGQTLTYTVSVTNVGNAPATGVIATDIIPNNTTFQSASNGGTFANGTVTWNIGSVAVGATVTRTVTVRVNSTVPAGVTQLINEVQVHDDGTNGPDPTPGNNIAFDTDTLVAAPDLVITKTDGLTQVVPGQLVTYTLVISNVGNQDATNVIVTDTLPPNTTFISSSRGGTFANGVVSGNLGTIAAGASITITGTLRVNNPQPAGVTSITNTVTVADDGANGPDPTPNNNTAADTDVLIAAPDLVITKDDGVDTAQPGQTLTYTLTIRNVGNQNATGVTVTDTIPANTTFDSASDGGTEGPTGVVTFNIGDLAAGATVTRTVTVVVANPLPAGTVITNTATVADNGANGPDPTPGNNTDTDTDSTGGAADLVVTKDDGVTTAQPDDTLTYTVTIRNVGAQDATGVIVTDTIPANTTFDSASDNGTFDSATGVVTWTVGTIGAGASVTRTVTVKVNSTIPAGVNSITNSASAFADAATGPDPTPDNNTATDTDTLNAAPDLVVTKTDGVTTARP